MLRPHNREIGNSRGSPASPAFGLLRQELRVALMAEDELARLRSDGLLQARCHRDRQAGPTAEPSAPPTGTTEEKYASCSGPE